MTYLRDTWYLLWRHIVTTIRIPIWLVVTIVQPMIWLLLYGQLFRRVVEIPGFDSSSYIQFLTPGVVIMTGGLVRPSKGTKIAYAGGKYSVTDGPFPETKELIDGFALIRADSLAAAIEHSKSFMAIAGDA